MSKHDGDRFCSNFFGNFQTNEKRKQYQKSCRDHNLAELEYLKKLKLLNKETNGMEAVAGNIFKHLLLDKSLQTPFIVYEFDTIIAETGNQSKVGELRKCKMNLFL